MGHYIILLIIASRDSEVKQSIKYELTANDGSS